MNIKRNILFALESRKRNGISIVDNVPIRMRVMYGGERVEFTTGYRIDAAKWDIEKQRVKNGCANKLKQTAADINAALLNFYTDIQGVFKEFEVLGVVPSPKQIKMRFNSKHKLYRGARGSTVDFFIAFDEFVKEGSSINNWAEGTRKKFTATRKHLIGFDAELSFEMLDEGKMSDYVAYLRGKKFLNSTIAKQVSLLEWFLRWCFRKGYTDNRIFDTFRLKLKTTQKKVVFLTWDELAKLRSYTLPEPKDSLDVVRDVFLFTCYTGLRYSDVNSLRRSNIKADHIEVTTQKTSDNLRIELNNHSRAILDKYKGVSFEDDRAFPHLSNQQMNKYLKKLCELAGIDEPICETYYKGNERVERVLSKHQLVGTHTGRRTFICNALSLGIPVQVVMKWTGHSDYKAMKPYIDVADGIKRSEMDKFNRM